MTYLGKNCLKREYSFVLSDRSVLSTAFVYRQWRFIFPFLYSPKMPWGMKITHAHDTHICLGLWVERSFGVAGLVLDTDRRLLHVLMMCHCILEQVLEIFTLIISYSRPQRRHFVKIFQQSLNKITVIAVLIRLPLSLFFSHTVVIIIAMWYCICHVAWSKVQREFWSQIMWSHWKMQLSVCHGNKARIIVLPIIIPQK